MSRNFQNLFSISDKEELPFSFSLHKLSRNLRLSGEKTHTQIAIQNCDTSESGDNKEVISV
jgi:hypothetical protein